MMDLIVTPAAEWLVPAAIGGIVTGLVFVACSAAARAFKPMSAEASDLVKQACALDERGQGR